MEKKPQVITLQNEYLRVGLTNYGAAIYFFQMKEGDGWADIALTRDTLEEFMENRDYYGATVGRVANRIKNGRAVIAGREYQLHCNEGANCLHSGETTFAWQLWDVEEKENGVIFRLQSPDGEGGFPGNVRVEAEYRLEGDRLWMYHRAETDQETIFGMTNHTYWCLSGLGEKIYDQQLQLNANFFIETDEELIPTGQILAVKGTAFDFNAPQRLGDVLGDEHPMIKGNQGYDVSFVRNQREYGLAARLVCPNTRRVLEVESSSPDMHLYTGNFLKNAPGKGDIRYTIHTALCLEPGRFPDTVNQPHFGEIFLKPGQPYEETICVRASHY